MPGRRRCSVANLRWALQKKKKSMPRRNEFTRRQIGRRSLVKHFIPTRSQHDQCNRIMNILFSATKNRQPQSTFSQPIPQVNVPSVELNRTKLPGKGVLKTSKPHPKPMHITLNVAETEPKTPKKSGESHNFKATPLNKKILKHVVGVPYIRPRPPTKPISPKFRINRLEEKRNEKTKAIVEKKKPTDELKERPTKRFKAQPMPDFSKTNLPFVKHKKTVVPKPFALHGDKTRKEIKEPNKMIAKDNHKEIKRMRKKVLPLKSESAAQYLPKNIEKLKVMDRQAEMMPKKEIEKAVLQKEKEEIEKFKKESQFKATKRLPDSIVKIAPSNKPLTIPKSPKFGVVKRKRE